jgi:zinc-binding alcohol dehydrogenase/oxidoreductase
MKSVVLQDNPQERLAIQDSPIPELKPGEVLVKIYAAALNHRDEWSRMGMYPGMRYPSILGSDGCGVVEKVADSNDEAWLGKTVIINPNVNWGENPAFQSLNYTILGMPTNGTLAEYVAVQAHRLHEKPAHLSHEQAAAIPLAGLTAYRAMFTKGEVKTGKSVLISGIGGGVALFALQFGVAAGAKVYVTSSKDQKIAKAVELGAIYGVNYKSETWSKDLLKREYAGFDAIIDGAGGPQFGDTVKLIASAGNYVVYGATAGAPSPLHLPRLFFSQASIKGSTMGNDQEFKAMVEFVDKHKIAPVISSVRPIDEAISAFDEMHEGKQFGKLVIKISE